MELVHPVYLDASMLVSFSAALNEGVSFESEVMERMQAAQEREGEASGRLSFSGLAAVFGLGADVSGRSRRQRSSEEGRETRVLRQHSEASLFNLLRHRLLSEKRVTVVTPDTILAELAPGQLVAVSGEVLGNPLAKILETLAAIAPFLGFSLDTMGEEERSQGSRDSTRH